jgi:nitroreductase
MPHLAEPAYPIHDLLRRRWSPRAFADRLVELEKIRSLLEAARWAASSSNEQPWSFIIATKDQPQAFERILTCFVEANRRWCKDAPLLMISVAAKNFARNGKPNAHARHDIGQAVADLTVQATSMDLFVHQMAGIEPETVRSVYGIPDDHEAVTGIAIGYLGDPATLPEELHKRELVPSTRKDQQAFVFRDKWGQPAV